MQKIDLVYMWVDGSDPEWLKTKNHYLALAGMETQASPEISGDNRWRDNDELKYSLRSVEKNAPWINHIYIITGFNQVPKWLNINHPKITIVPHESIFPADALPTFNSNAIEMCIPNIPDLSEHFLLANDDCFFFRPLKPSFFFDSYGRAIVWYGHKSKNAITRRVHSAYIKTLILATHKILDIFGRDYTSVFPSHNIDAYIKSSMLAAQNHPQLKAYIKNTVYSKFRTEHDAQRWLFNLYDNIHGRNVLKRVRNKKLAKHWIYNLIYRKRFSDSPVYYTNLAQSNIMSVKPSLFCVNDTENSTDEIRQNNHEILEKLFPNKSTMEL